MKTCIIHIGAHKTGTSALQSLLYTVSESPDANIVYPKSCLWKDDRSHNMLGLHFWEDFRPDLSKPSLKDMTSALLLEARQGFETGRPKLVISSEVIEKAVLYKRELVREFLSQIKSDGYHIKILYVVRRQDYAADSIFKQWVREYDTRFKGDPLQFALNEIDNLKYSRIADLWREIPEVDDLGMVPYHENNLTKTLHDSASIIGLPDGVFSLDPGVHNPSLDGTMLRFKHFLNNFTFDRKTNDHYVNFSMTPQVNAKIGGGA